MFIHVDLNPGYQSQTNSWPYICCIYMPLLLLLYIIHNFYLYNFFSHTHNVYKILFKKKKSYKTSSAFLLLFFLSLQAQIQKNIIFYFSIFQILTPITFPKRSSILSGSTELLIQSVYILIYCIYTDYIKTLYGNPKKPPYIVYVQICMIKPPPFTRQ